MNTKFLLFSLISFTVLVNAQDTIDIIVKNNTDGIIDTVLLFGNRFDCVKNMRFPKRTINARGQFTFKIFKKCCDSFEKLNVFVPSTGLWYTHAMKNPNCKDMILTVSGGPFNITISES